jgi:hypothetical protein
MHIFLGRISSDTLSSITANLSESVQKTFIQSHSSHASKADHIHKHWLYRLGQHFFFVITATYDIIEGELEKIFYSRTAHHARI